MKKPDLPPPPKHPAALLGAACARRGLRLKQAQALFEAMIVADAIMLTAGNETAAAALLGIDRITLYRMQARKHHPSRRQPKTAQDGVVLVDLGEVVEDGTNQPGIPAFKSRRRA
jgi:DNA-binding NtrC family response regulator